MGRGGGELCRAAVGCQGLSRVLVVCSDIRRVRKATEVSIRALQQPFDLYAQLWHRYKYKALRGLASLSTFIESQLTQHSTILKS